MRLTDQIGTDPGKPRDTAQNESYSPAVVIPHAPGQEWVEERTRIAVGRDVNVSGKLVFQEPVRIEGRFRGEVSSADLVVISEEASVEGQVHAPRLMVLGELRGDAVGSKFVVVGPTARIFGRIEAESLTVCEGARLNGDVSMPGLRAEK